MDPQDSKRLSVTADPTFWEIFLATLILVRFRWQLWFLVAVFPLAGLCVLITPIARGNPLELPEIGMAVFCFLFFPLLTAYHVWTARRRNKLAQGPFTYSFDAEGVHTSGGAFSQTIRWPAIPRIRRSKRFLFIFVAPGRAYAIPTRAINDEGFFDALRGIAGGQTNFDGKW